MYHTYLFNLHLLLNLPYMYIHTYLFFHFTYLIYLYLIFTLTYNYVVYIYLSFHYYVALTMHLNSYFLPLLHCPCLWSRNIKRVDDWKGKLEEEKITNSIDFPSQQNLWRNGIEDNTKASSPNQSYFWHYVSYYTLYLFTNMPSIHALQFIYIFNIKF